MKGYWDSSALVETVLDDDLHERLKTEGAWTRRHSLVEMFSALTGKVHLRMEANEAHKAIKEMSGHLEFVELTTEEILAGLSKAQSLGVRGGRVHDYVHALAARKSGATRLLTLDRNDFEALASGLTVEQV